MRRFHLVRGERQKSAWRNEFARAQDGKCAICRRPFGARGPQLDHCHATGFVRGALCLSCNVKLGWYERHRALIEGYIERARAAQGGDTERAKVAASG